MVRFIIFSLAGLIVVLASLTLSFAVPVYIFKFIFECFIQGQPFWDAMLMNVFQCIVVEVLAYLAAMVASILMAIVD